MAEVESSKDLSQVGSFVSEKLYEISQAFKPGTKFTLLARQPDNDDADFIISSDTDDEVIKAFQRKHDTYVDREY